MERTQLLSLADTGKLAGVARGTRESVLSAIREPDISLSVWGRTLPASLERRIAAWGAAAPPAFDEVLPAEGYDCGGLATGMEHSLRRWLLNDVGRIVRHFLRVVDGPRFRLFFGAVCHDQCRKFHVDYVRLRLVSTYAGPGTEWLPDAAVNRSELAQPGQLVPDANRRIVKDTREVRRARPGEVLFMKGALFGNGHERGAVHRSPEIVGTGVSRVVLTLTALGGAP